MKTWGWVLGVLLFTAAACGLREQQAPPDLRAVRLHEVRAEVPCPAGVGDASVIQAKRELLKTRYGIDVDLEPKAEAKDKLEYVAVAPQEMAVIQVYLTVALDQLAKHPPEFFEAAEIKKFAYVKEPHVEGYPIAGLAMYDEGQLLFSVDTEDCAPNHIADTLHHEIFHFFHGNPEPPLFEEADWAKLNPPGFKYDTKEDPDTELTHPQAGFVSEYAMVSEGEDTAEVFAALMLGDTARLVKEWSASDVILASKVDFIKKLMAKVSPIYSEAYWENILNERDG